MNRLRRYPDWREDYKRKLVSPEDAVKVVKSGDRVVFPLMGVPRVLPQALYARRAELRNVEILMNTPEDSYPWFDVANQESFMPNVESCFSSYARIREGVTEKRIPFTPNLMWMWPKTVDEPARAGWARQPDMVMTVVGPPDGNGFCCFGEALWSKKDYCRRARTVVAEVDNNQIRTFGDNYIHVSEVDYFVEHTPREPSALFKLADELRAFKPAEGTRRIAELVSSLINDGDTVQIGWSMNTMLFPWLGVFDNKQDLGWCSELTPPGITTLIKNGVFTGRRRNIYMGKAVCTALFGTSEERKFYANNPTFELYDVSFTNNPRNIAANDNLLAINGALAIDLTGQIANEVIPGTGMVWNGQAGQPEWVVGAMLSKGGRSIHCLNSTNRDGTASRIVPSIPEGTPVTISRYWADTVVTEHGIAHLLGKSLRERADALIAIAHPDFRGELRQAARKLFWP